MKVPDDFPINLSEFLEQSLDFRKFNGGNGISFAQLYELMAENNQIIRDNFPEAEFTESIIDDITAYVQTEKGAENDLFLSTFRALKGDVACVYGVLKDRQVSMMNGMKSSWFLRLEASNIDLSNHTRFARSQTQ